MVNKLESTWLERIWLGRDSKTDEHLIGTPNGMVRSRALKRSVERRRWDPSLLKATVWDPWNPTPVTRGRPLKVRSDREPILMGPIPRVRFTLPDEPDAVTTAAPAVPVQETTSATATQSVAEKARVRLPEAEAEGAPPVQRTKTTSSVPVTTTAEETSQTTQHLRQEDSLSVLVMKLEKIHNLFRCVELQFIAECEESSTSDDIAEARPPDL